MTAVRSGLRENAGQFALQLVTVLLVGATVGAEKTVVSKLGESTFGVESFLLLGTFVVTFGVVKAAMNLVSSRLAERGRKRVLVTGWVVALPVPVVLVLAPDWWWIVAANVLLGVNQGMTFSMTVNSAIDLSGPEVGGLAVGLVESAGYAGVAASAWATGVLAGAYGLRPAPFHLLGAVVVVGLAVATVAVRDTLSHAEAQAEMRGRTDGGFGEHSFPDTVRRATVGDRTLFAACQAGHVEKFVDALVWIAYPIYLTAAGLSLGEVGFVVFVYNGTWALLQVPAGRLADVVGRRTPIVSGMFLAGAGVLLTAAGEGYVLWVGAAAVTGAGIALIYPNLQAVFGDAAHPSWRATGIGVYRMWRDAGYGVGAVAIGVVADLASVTAAFYLTGVAMFASGTVALAWLSETHAETRGDPFDGEVPDPEVGSD